MFAPHDLEPDTVRPLRRTEYDRLVALGVFDEDERVELLYGQLVTMSPSATTMRSPWRNSPSASLWR